MSKQVNIEYVAVQTPTVIEVDGKKYPIHRRNMEVIREYETTKDEAVLDKLVDFSFVI